MKAVLCFLTLSLVCWGCGGSPTAPDAPQETIPADELATISGQIYDNVGGADRAIVEALVEVNPSDGSSIRAMTSASGAYRLTVRRGSVTVTASKDGYESTQWQFDLTNDIVLNFGLNPR